MSGYEERGYYEVQLNNKQLVFFFMAAVAIAVVVFLCGVMVGRGVKETVAASAVMGVPGSGGTSADLGPSRSEFRRELDFPRRLESPQVDDSLEPSGATSGRPRPETVIPPRKVEPPAASPVARETPAEKPAPARSSPPPAPAAAAEAPSAGYAVQVVALKTRDSADSLVNRLKDKGYRAYVEPGDDSGLYRVRVGRFSERAEAEQVAVRLREVERFKPYVIQ
jgi:cell division septation protein DedD